MSRTSHRGWKTRTSSSSHSGLCPAIGGLGGRTWGPDGGFSGVGNGGVGTKMLIEGEDVFIFDFVVTSEVMRIFSWSFGGVN